jgi:hypothetical protein
VISFAVIGGLLLNVGAYLTFKGKIYQSVMVYLLADLCWIIMAYERDDIWGVISIIVGVSFGVLAFYKMHTGAMNKNLNKQDEEK